MSENDIREMLIDGLGKIKYDLLKTKKTIQIHFLPKASVLSP